MTTTQTGCTLCRRWNQHTEPIPGCPGDMRCIDRTACDRARHGVPEPARGIPAFDRYSVPGSPIGRIMSTADRITAQRQALDTIRELTNKRHTQGGDIRPAELYEILRKHGV